MKVESGLKKPKDYVGKLPSYHINTALLKEMVSSWTEDTTVVWKKVGDSCIKDKENNTPSNSGQIAKQYLLEKESYEGLQFTYKGQNGQKLGGVLNVCFLK